MLKEISVSINRKSAQFIATSFLSHSLLLKYSNSMDSEASRTLISRPNPPPLPQQNPKTPNLLLPKDRDFLSHLEVYLAKRDGVDKLLKISRYATKIILSSAALPETLTLTKRLKSFESSVGVSRKAFRLGKFVQDINALRNSHFDSKQDISLSIIAYGGEGLYFFVEQFIWFAKSGLIDSKHSRTLQRISAWAEFIGYIGSISLKLKDLKRIEEEEKCLKSSIEIAITRRIGYKEEADKMRKLKEKSLLKRLSVVQDLADGLMALADIRDGNGLFLGPLSVSCAGLLSALISTHKNWVSC